MIKPLIFYFRKGLWPRLWRILFQLQVLLSIGIGVVCFRWGPSLSAAQLKTSDVGTMILTYAAIAFGFCITGMALVLTLPSDRFLRTLQRHKAHTNGQSSYLEVLFVFSWTAVCHWFLVVSAIAAILIRANATTIVAWGDSRCWRAFVSWFFALSAYSLIQFLMTVITLAQVGELYSRELDRDEDSTSHPPPA